MTNKIAVITGATSGIGAEFAKRFASQNYDLIITGRREAKIKALAEELKKQYKINVEVIIAELANENDLKLLEQKIQNSNNLEILVNNAGFGDRKPFAEGNIDLYQSMVTAHITATMKLTKAALNNMLTNKAGTIINVASIGAFIRFPGSNIYCATKAFITLFSETLSLELNNSGIKIQSLCPGLTITDFFTPLNEDVKELEKSRSWLYKTMTAKEVVDISFNYLAKNKSLCIPGFRNRLLVYYRTLQRFFNLILCQTKK